MLPVTLLVLSLFSVAVAGPAQDSPNRRATTKRAGLRLARCFQPKSLELPSGETYKYAVFIPPQYGDDPSHQWPLILFLHGSGERGRDGVGQTRVGLPKYITRHADRFPFITVMPQAHAMWFRGQNAAAVWAMLDATGREYRVDPDRIYITGLSMGGFATWEFAMSRPDVFAAAVPVCGAGEKTFVSNMRQMPTWVFHGRRDQNVPVRGSRDAVEALRQLGAEPKYTEYPGLGHQCWDRAYGTMELWRWLLKQRRPPPPRVIDYRLPGGAARIWWLGVQADKGGKKPARVRAEITEDNLIRIDSEAVVAWSIISDGPPLEPGSDIRVIWNGKPVYQGRFTGSLSVRPNGRPTSQPASQSAQ